MTRLTLTLLSGRYTVYRLPPSSAIPDWVAGAFFSITRTPDELSIVCPERTAPENVSQEAGWSCLKVKGPLDFDLVGILSSLLDPLATAGIAVFTISTYDTDHILVKTDTLDAAFEALRSHGHTILN